jgi:uncharacterized membrane protein YhiD involved in acid resistance
VCWCLLFDLHKEVDGMREAELAGLWLHICVFVCSGVFSLISLAASSRMIVSCICVYAGSGLRKYRMPAVA